MTSEEREEYGLTASKKKTADYAHKGTCDKCGKTDDVWDWEFENNPDREPESWCYDCMTPKQRMAFGLDPVKRDAKKKTASDWEDDSSVDIEFTDGSAGIVYYEKRSNGVAALIEKNGEIIEEFRADNMDEAIKKVDRFIKTATKKTAGAVKEQIELFKEEMESNIGHEISWEEAEELFNQSFDHPTEAKKTAGKFQVGDSARVEKYTVKIVEVYDLDDQTSYKVEFDDGVTNVFDEKELKTASKKTASDLDEVPSEYETLPPDFQEFLLAAGINKKDWTSTLDNQDRQGYYEDWLDSEGTEKTADVKVLNLKEGMKYSFDGSIEEIVKILTYGDGSVFVTFKDEQGLTNRTIETVDLVKGINEGKIVEASKRRK